MNAGRKLSAIALSSVVALLAACSDSTVAPTANVSRGTIEGGGANAALTSWDTLRFSFVIDPSRTITYSLGLGNSIVFPAGSLCDVSSSYGPTEWDKSCAVATTPLVVNAKAWLDASGHPRLDFEQHIRFVPSLDPTKWVILTLTDYRGAITPSSTVGYCATVTSSCINEGLTDPSVLTVKNPLTGQLTRRIKHFSGYNVFSGRSCDSDPSCGDGSASMSRRHVDSPPPASTPTTPTTEAGTPEPPKRQGYMLAWG